ncbi:MAG: ABC transporter permease [Deltaproteobacteria bacterium]|nr:ABC transporter permease [Deltaproteobacteria bacterium]
MWVIISFIKKELRQIKRDKRILPILVVAPVLQLLVLGYAATFDIKNIEFAVCDFDMSNSSRELIDNFTSSSYFILKYQTHSTTEIDTLLSSGRIKSALIIPKNFEKQLYTDRNTKVLFLTDGTEGTMANVSLMYARTILSRFINRYNTGQMYRVPAIRYELRIWYNPDLKSSNFMVPAIFALLLSIVAMLIPSMALVKEKETGTIEQLYVTPIKPYQIIFGKMSAFMLISIIDVVIVTTIAVLWFNVPLRGSLFDLVAAILLFLISTLGIATFFSTVTNTQQQAMMSVMFLFFLPSMLLSGFIFPVENIPLLVRWISYILPLTYFIDILRNLFLKGSTISELWIQYSMLSLIGIAIFIFSLLKFRKNID